MSLRMGSRLFLAIFLRYSNTASLSLALSILKLSQNSRNDENDMRAHLTSSFGCWIRGNGGLNAAFGTLRWTEREIDSKSRKVQDTCADNTPV